MVLLYLRGSISSPFRMSSQPSYRNGWQMITSFGSKLVSCTCGAGEKHVGLPYTCWSAIKYNERQFWLQVANIVSVAIQTFEDYTSVNLCDVRNGTILRWHHSSNVKADSKRPSPISYSRLIMTVGVSLTVTKLVAFVSGPEMTSCRFLR